MLNDVLMLGTGSVDVDAFGISVMQRGGCCASWETRDGVESLKNGRKISTKQHRTERRKRGGQKRTTKTS